MRPWARGQNFPRPENALKRAEELLRVGQKQAALQTLHNVFTGSGRRFRTWSTVYETIIVRHLDLCCEMRKGRYAKEALQQYRNMCQSVSISSLEEVITHFMRRAQEKADEARAASDAAALDIDDLDVDATPEDIMLSYVSGDKSKDRTDRTMVTPWFRFLWETYRNLLDILRHNSRLQTLYASSIKRAFAFCVSYKRTSEFRRLCELLRSHLTNIQRRAFYGKDQKDRPDLTNIETLQLYVETRFEQLKAACELELWQEAFRSVEDIINLVVINPSIIQPSMMATYYSRLTQIFAFSDESSLYCAYAWYKLYKLAITYNKKLTEVDVQMLSTSVLLAALGICPYNRENALHREVRSEAVAERLRRMSNILRFGLESKTETAEVYSREALLKELSSDAFLSNVPEQVQALYHLLEHDFNPLGMCKTVDALTEQLSQISRSTSSACPDISVDLSRHAPSLKLVAVLKMLQQLSQVYSNMKTSFLTELVPAMSFGEIESIIVNSVKNRFIKIRIDHKDGTLHFGEDNLDSDTFVKRLSVLAERMGTAQEMILTQAHDNTRALKLKASLNDARDRMEEEHAMALSRKQMIEQRKEEQELFLLEKERAEERKRREQMQQAQAAEALRRQQEAEKREQERIQREQEEKEIEEAKTLLEKGNKKLKPGQKLDKQKIIQEVLTEQLKEQQELERQMNKMSKRLDHLERACREEEVPLIAKAEQDRIKEERVLYEQESARNVENHRKAWEIDVAEKGRLLKTLDDKESFADTIRSRRREEFEARRRAREREIAERKEKRRQELVKQRKIFFATMAKETLIAIAKAEEEERLKAEQEREAERRRIKEEEKRIEQEKREAELKRISEIQRKREEEIEAKKERARRETLEGDKWGRRDRASPTRAPREDDRWRRNSPARRPQPVSASDRQTYQPPRGIRTQPQDYNRRASPQRWQTRSNRSPPRSPAQTPTRSPKGGEWSRVGRQGEDRSEARDNRPPIAAPPRASAGYVPSGGRTGFQDSRPPASSYNDSFYRGGGSSDKWRPSRDDRDRPRDYGSGGMRGQDSSQQSGTRSGSGSYVPPGRRTRDARDAPRETRDRDRW